VLALAVQALAAHRLADTSRAARALGRCAAYAASAGAAGLLAPGGGLGAGDVKLAGLIGTALGSGRINDAIVATVLGLVIGAIASGVILARKNAKALIALAPAILSGEL
jgi:leader peptidase (prepilin peptidase)/N-methyltransferase